MNKICVAFIELYRKYISPLKGKPCCKYYPTCSQYAKLCYQRFNFFKATMLSVWRILRCNPLSKGGIDYPPEKREVT